ncbi:MAG: lipid-A-disaccharide synthase [Deltaproteobacteria bacterium]|nr:lipid-A-disaccharide synthase [Deltaproteobacteria bacterium]
MKDSKLIMVVTGEASSDQHAAAVITALKKFKPDWHVFAMGGHYLAQAGAELLVDIKTHGSVMGLTEVLGSAGKIIKAFKTLEHAAAEKKPDLVMLVDYPDFNLRLAKKLHGQGFSILYFISPQLWAWRQGRAKIIKRCVKKVATIFPFEEVFYRGLGINAEFVGHPFMDRKPLALDREKFCHDLGLDPAKPIVALLPGSRKKEIETLLIVLVQTIMELRKTLPDVQAIIPIAPTVKEHWLAPAQPLPAGVVMINGQAIETLAVADAGIIASGTAAMEGALAELPMMVVYKLTSLSYFFAQRLIGGVKNFAMPNIIAGKEIVREFVQEQVNPIVLAAELAKLLTDEQYRTEKKQQLRLVKEQLKHRQQGEMTAGERVAQIIIELGNESGNESGR